MNLTDFLPDIRLEIAGCPEAVLLNALRHALREFCWDSGAWQVDLAPISLAVDTAQYTPTYTAGEELVRILTATYDGSPVGVYTPAEMDEALSNWRTATGTGVRAIIPNSMSTVLTYPIPASADTKTVALHVAVQPTVAATSCHDDLGRWREAIAFGAIARLKALPNKPWTDRESVSYYRGKFQEGMTDARIAALRGPAQRSLSVKPRRFA